MIKVVDFIFFSNSWQYFSIHFGYKLATDIWIKFLYIINFQRERSATNFKKTQFSWLNFYYFFCTDLIKMESLNLFIYFVRTYLSRLYYLHFKTKILLPTLLMLKKSLLIRMCL